MRKKTVLFFGTVSILLLFNAYFFHNIFFGRILVFFLFLHAVFVWHDALSELWGLAKRGFLSLSLGLFGTVFVYSFFGSLFIFSYKFTPIFSLFSLFFSLWIGELLVFSLQKKKPIIKTFTENHADADFWIKRYLPRLPALFFVYLGLWFSGVVFILVSKTNSILFSPWQAIHGLYPYVFFFATFLLGFIVFSSQKPRVILGVFVLHSLMLYMYIPFTHVLPWGGDAWRHMAIEQKIYAGEFIEPVIFGGAKDDGFLKNARALISTPQKLSYAGLWSIETGIIFLTGFSLYDTHARFLPLLWALLLPGLFLLAGERFFHSKRIAVVFVFLSFLPFTLQAVGGFGLPVAFGFLSFCFTLFAWLTHARDRDPRQKQVAIFFSIITVCGYALSGVLLILLFGILFFVKKTIFQKKGVWPILVLFVFSLFAMPAFELVQSKNEFVSLNEALKGALRMASHMSGLYVATGPLSHDSVIGNIFFNQTPDYASVKNIFSFARFSVPLLLLGIWGLAFSGVYRALKKRKSISEIVAAFFFVVVVGGYAVGWIFLKGDLLFIRRLDPWVASFVLVFFVYGFNEFFVQRTSQHKTGVRIIFFIFLVSFFSTFAYVSGPDTRSTAEGEFHAAEFVWEEQSHVEQNYCVIADTWTLLALEAVSGKQIVGGGFPIGYDFGQPERVRLYESFFENPEFQIFKEAENLTGAKRCWLILPKNKISEEKINRISSFGNVSLERDTDGYTVWRFR